MTLFNGWVKIALGLIAVLLMLPGCQTTPQAPEIVRYPVYVVIEPKASLLVPTKKAQPPNREEYLALDERNIKDWRERERLLSNAYIMQSSAVDQCNADKASISEFIRRATKEYENKKDQ